MKKILFFVVWASTILLVPVTIFKVTPLSLALSEQKLLINFLQRFTGLLAFTLLFWQIVLGAFMEKWIEKLGGWVFRFHITEGAIAYSLVVLHPLLFMLFSYRAFGKLDPFYVFTDFCVLCPNKLETLYTFGRIAFWLITIAVIAARFRTRNWLKVYWRKFHILNYVAFLFLAVHSSLVGSEIRLLPMSLYFYPALFVVGLTIISKLLTFIQKKQI